MYWWTCKMEKNRWDAVGIIPVIGKDMKHEQDIILGNYHKLWIIHQ